MSNFAQNVIARRTTEGTPIVFFADAEPKDSVTAYVFKDKAMQEGSVVDISLDSYRATLPLSPEDTKLALEAYKKASNLPVVGSRQRMPYRKMANIVSVLSQDINIPQEQRQVLQHMDAKEQQLSPRQRAAKERYARENAQSVLKHLKELPGNATQQEKEQAVKELGDAMARILAGLL